MSYRNSYLYILLELTGNLSYFKAMKATITSKGQITIPLRIRNKLGLAPGVVLEFAEDTPYLKAVPAFDDDEMRSVLGCAKTKLGRNSVQWLNETRGVAQMPPEKP